MSDRTAWLAALGDLPVDADTLFPDEKGFFARRAGAAKAKLLARSADVLRRALRPGERIRFASSGVRFWFWEWQFAGWAAYYHNRYLVVLTSQRLLFLQITSRGNPADIKNAVRLDAIRGTTRKSFLGRFVIHTADGKDVKLSGMPMRDRKPLAALLPTSAGPVVPGAAVLEHLCPSCLAHVPGPVGTALRCPEPACRIPFRDPARAARLSTWLPGLGDLYLGHHLFGATEFLGSAVALAIALVVILIAALGAEPAGWAAVGILVPLLVAVPRLIDRPLTLHMARKGLVPLALVPAPGAAARNLPAFPRWAPLLFALGAVIVVGVPALLAGDLAADARFDREVVAVAKAGRFDEALAAYDTAKAAGQVTEVRRVHLLEALYDAGDLAGADRIRSELEGTPIDDTLARSVNRKTEAEQAAIASYQAGLRAFFEGDEEGAWAKLDPALAYFREVKRPHLPGTRAELRTHLAAAQLAPPVDAESVAFARRMLDAAGAEAPPAEAAVVRAALAAAEGDRARATAALADAPAVLEVGFHLLALETRARLAADPGERAAIAEAARAIPAAELDAEDAKRAAALADRTRL